MKSCANIFHALLDGGDKGCYTFKTCSDRIQDTSLGITREGPNYIMLHYPDNPIKQTNRDVFLFENYIKNQLINKVEIPTNILNDIDREEWSKLEKEVLKFLLNNKQSAIIKLNEKNNFYVSVVSNCID